jgi:hypothetical protein
MLSGCSGSIIALRPATEPCRMPALKIHFQGQLPELRVQLLEGLLGCRITGPAVEGPLPCSPSPAGATG